MKKDKKRKKKVKETGPSNIRIIDDDIDLKAVPAREEDDDDMAYAPAEEKPLVAAVVDERPNYLKRKDIDRSRWKTLDPVDVKVKEEPNTPSTSNTTTENTKEKHHRRHDSDSDISPPRRRHDSDSDLSPPRVTKRSSVVSLDDDLSPPRRRTRHDSDSDLSPPRRSSISPSRRRHHDDKRRHVSPTPNRETSDKYKTSHRERTSRDSSSRRKESDRHTLSGKVAGLSDSKSVREEIKKLKSKEGDMLKAVGEDALGRNAKTVYRDKSTGKIRDLEAEASVNVKVDPEEEARNAKYQEWSQGLKQREERKQKIEENLKEMEKPLARYEDDVDREAFLRERELEDDPMLQYMRKKKQKETVKEASGKGEIVFVKPRYQGPPAPPNRFGIQPGYRWDGVNRSNGFEQKLTDRAAERNAIQEEAYKWSTEDM